MTFPEAFALAGYTTLMWFIPSIIYLETRKLKYVLLQVITIIIWA
jgi:hypothetical protein